MTQRDLTSVIAEIGEQNLLLLLIVSSLNVDTKSYIAGQYLMEHEGELGFLSQGDYFIDKIYHQVKWYMEIRYEVFFVWRK